MKVVVAEDTGFCYGVKRAIDIVTERLKEKGKVYSLGPLIHNQIVIRELEKKGLRIVDNPSQIRGDLIIRSHGLHPVLIEEVKKRNLRIIDATCPFVKMVQRRVKYLITNGYEVIIVGDPNPPEVRTLSGFARDEAIIIKQNSKFKIQTDAVVARSTFTEPVLERSEGFSVNSVPWQSHKVGVVSQTTINSKDYRKTVAQLYKKIKPEEFLIFDTVCQITEKRQKEVSALSRKVDAFLVLGGKESSNTRTLYEMCRKKGPAFLVESSSQIKKEWFTGVKTVGILSGTSTPDWVIKEAIDTLEKLTQSVIPSKARNLKNG